jgi:hypothetical protein
VYTTRFNIQKFYVLPYVMCFVWISEQTVIFSVHNINWLVCITETECVYCTVRPESLLIGYVYVAFTCLQTVFLCAVFCQLTQATHVSPPPSLKNHWNFKFHFHWSSECKITALYTFKSPAGHTATHRSTRKRIISPPPHVLRAIYYGMVDVVFIQPKLKCRLRTNPNNAVINYS